MLFSIIIPFYNSENTISKTLNSLVLQKKNFEVIMINDFSNKASLEKIEKFKKKFKFLKILNNNKNLGVSKSRNKGINFSKGKYLIFLDSDDYISKNSLNYLESFIEQSKDPDVVFTKYWKDTYPSSNLEIINACNKKNKNYFFNYILKKKFPLDECWPYVVKRDFIKKNKINFDNFRVAEDQLYVLKVFLNMKNISFFKRNFYMHQNLSNTLSDFMNFEAGFDCLKVLIQYLKIKKKTKNITFYKLCEFYIQNVLSMFSGILVQCNSNEVSRYYKYAKKYKLFFKNLISRRENFIFKKNLDNNFIFLYRKNIINKKNKLLINIKKNSKIFIFCYSKFAGAAIEILGKKNNLLSNIVDDNKNLKNKKLKKYKIINSQSLLRKIRYVDKCIIANHRDITLRKISKDLQKKGIKKNQLIQFKF